MITLITGSPGSGKTLYCVDKILSDIIGTKITKTNEDNQSEIIERQIYANINGLLIEHEMIDSDWLLSIHNNKTKGSFIVFDEVQRVWPNRPPASKKPESVQYLETHRHDGIDLVLLTQNPQLLDPAVRALVGRHLHIRRLGGMGAAVVYEWDGTSNGLNFKQAFAKHPYKYNRKAFKLYKSAEIHTKQTRRLPFAVYVALAGVIGAAFMWPRFSSNILNKAENDITPVSAPQIKPKPFEAQTYGKTVNFGTTGKPGESPETKSHQELAKEYETSLTPLHPARPWTAPRYAAITQPVRAPYPAACIEMQSRGCTCYSQQGTPLTIPYSACKSYIKTGFFLDFDPEPQRNEGGMIGEPVIRPGREAERLIDQITTKPILPPLT